MNEETPLGRPLAVPSGRMARAARLGSVATGIASGAAWRGMRSYAAGGRPDWQTLLLTPENLRRLTDALARMRGAAMKLGQLVSMDTGDVLPPELAQVMARLRAEADYMPPRQLRQVLDRAWGAGWQARFRRFEVRPLAAASIGQVHRAVGADGRALAIKVQYPGVRRSIDSDVDNVAGLIRMSGLLPPGMDLAPLLDEAKRQLHAEADYLREAESLARFGALVADAPEFDVPAPVPELTTASVLAMDFAPGVPLESLAQAPQGERDRIVAALLELLLREMFEFGCMQTDPNFANYRYQPQTGRIVLLDFGALRDFDPAVMEAYRALLRAGLAGDRAALVEAALALGFFAEDTAPHHSAAVIDMTTLAFDAFRHEGAFDFGASDLVLRLRDRGMEIGMDRSFTHIPPMDVLYLQRKIGGLFLLGRTLGARVDVGAMAARWL